MIGNIRAVTFDLWQTLIVEDHEINKRRAQLRIDRVADALRTASRSYPEEELWRAFGECVSLCAEFRLKGREVSFDGQINIFLERLKPGLSGQLSHNQKRAVREAYDLAFLDAALPADPAAVPVLKALKDRGCSLGLISNTAMTSGATFRVHLTRLGLLHFFDTVVFSDEIGYAKPSGRVFRRSLDALEVLPEATVHVGDDRAADVGGALKAGLRAIWVARPPDSYDEPYAYQPPTDDQPHATVTSLGEVIPALERLGRDSLCP